MQGSAQLAERQNGSQFSPVRVGVHLLKTVMQKDWFLFAFGSLLPLTLRNLP
jgi:hypothetical protein